MAGQAVHAGEVRPRKRYVRHGPWASLRRFGVSGQDARKPHRQRRARKKRRRSRSRRGGGRTPEGHRPSGRLSTRSGRKDHWSGSCGSTPPDDVKIPVRSKSLPSVSDPTRRTKRSTAVHALRSVGTGDSSHDRPPSTGQERPAAAADRWPHDEHPGGPDVAAAPEYGMRRIVAALMLLAVAPVTAGTLTARCGHRLLFRRCRGDPALVADRSEHGMSVPALRASTLGSGLRARQLSSAKFSTARVLPVTMMTSPFSITVSAVA